MEGRQVHEPPKRTILAISDESSAGEEIEVHHQSLPRRKKDRSNIPSDFSGHQPADEHNSNQSNGLPFGKMTAALRNMNNKRNETKHRKESERSSIGSPFTPGRNTMNKHDPSPSGTASHQTRKQVNSSRRPLQDPSSSSNFASFSQPPGRPIDLKKRQHNPLHLSSRPDATSTPRAGPSQSRNHHQQHFPQTQHTQSTKEVDLLESEESPSPEPEIRPGISIRGHSGSKSPQKLSTSNGGHRRSSIENAPPPIFSHATRSGGVSSDRKGKGRMEVENHRHSSPTKTSGQNVPLVEEEINDPDGLYKEDLDAKGTGPDSEEVQYISDPGPYPDKRAGKFDQRQTLMINKIVSNPAPQQPPRKVGGISRMKDKNGNLPPECPPLKSRFTKPKADPAEPIPSALSNRPQEQNADVRDAWLSPGSRIKVDTLLLKREFLRVYAGIGVSGKWWDIAFQTIRSAEICRSANCPFLMLDLSVIDGTAREEIEAMLAAKNTPPHDYVQSTTICLVLAPGNTAKSLVEALSMELNGRDIKHQYLDANACETLRLSCNTQERSTRARADAARRERAAQEAESARRPKGQRKSSAKDEEESNRPKSKTKEKQIEDPSQPKLNFSAAPKAAPTRRSARQSTSYTVQNVEESDSDQSATTIAKPKAMAKKMQFSGDRNELLFPYPPTGRADVNITIGDAQRIETGEFLNDTLLEFGLRHVLRNLNKEIQDTIHLFNSFFYERLSNKAKKSEKGAEYWPGYESVKKWSKGQDIFDKKYIVIPINEHFHWYLAVIINPSGILRPKPREDSPVMEGHRPVTRAIAEDTDNDIGVPSSSTSVIDEELEVGRKDDSVTDGDVSLRVYADLDDLDSEPGGRDSRQTTPKSSEQLFPDNSNEAIIVDEDENGDDEGVGNVTMQSIVSQDELDCIGGDESVYVTVNNTSRGKGQVSEVEKGVETMDISDKEDDVDLIGTGNPIVTPTLLALRKQQEEVKNPSSAPVAATQGKKRAAPKPDAQIIDSDDTWIITFDSLGGPHKAVGTQLNMWLRYEAKDKKKIDYEPVDAIYWEGKVPQQNNFYDCGLYVVHYAKQFLEKSSEVLEFIQHRAPYTSSPDRQPWEAARDKAWAINEAGNLRENWTVNLVSLAANYKMIQGSKPDQKDESENPDETLQEDVEQDQAIVDDSQGDSVAAIGASQFFNTAPTSREEDIEDQVNLIPGAFPTPNQQVRTKSSSPIKEDLRNPEVIHPPGAAIKKPAGRPSWVTSSPVKGAQGTESSAKKSVESHSPEPTTSTSVTRSRSPLSPGKDQIPRGNFTNHPTKDKTTPGRNSISEGIVLRKISQFDPNHTAEMINGQSSARRSSSPIKQNGLSEEDATRHAEVEHLRPPKRLALADVPNFTSKSSNISSGSNTSKNDTVHGYSTTSPLGRLSMGIPGRRDDSINMSPRIPSAVNTIASNSNRGNQYHLSIPSSPLIANDDDDTMDVTIPDISSSSIQTRSQQQQQENVKVSSSSSEEEEPVEDLPPKTIISPIKHTYQSKAKKANANNVPTIQTTLPVKRLRSTSNSLNQNDASKKVKQGPGHKREEAIIVDTDDDDED